MTFADLETLPPTIEMGMNGCTMTFLRNQAYLSRVHVPAISSSQGETLNVPPHWHEEHDELFRVVKGRLRVMIGTETKDYTPEDGEILVPKGTVHSLRGFYDEETIFEEKTGPVDLQKEIFFRNIFAENEPPKSMLQAMLAMYKGDMRMALSGHIKWVERGIMTILGGYVAPLLGYKVKFTGVKPVETSQATI